VFPLPLKLFLIVYVLLMRGRLAERSDEELLERFAHGDARAIGVLYDRHARALVAYTGMKMGGNRTAAEDVLQDAFTKLMRAVEDGTRIHNVRGWLSVTCRHLAIDQLRKATRQRATSLDDEPAQADIPKAVGDPLRDATDRQFSDDLQAALDELPEEQRETFLMKEVLGYKFREIAEAMDTTESTVKSRLRYALQKLRGALEGWA
jgi:RNA polymerase sigma-70 factor, ECF subfamily